MSTTLLVRIRSKGLTILPKGGAGVLKGLCRRVGGLCRRHAQGVKVLQNVNGSYPLRLSQVFNSIDRYFSPLHHLLLSLLLLRYSSPLILLFISILAYLQLFFPANTSLSSLTLLICRYSSPYPCLFSGIPLC